MSNYLNRFTLRKAKPPNISEDTDTQLSSNQLAVKKSSHVKKRGVLVEVEVDAPWPQDSLSEHDDPSNLNGKFKRTLSLSKSGRCKSLSKQKANRQSIMSSDLYSSPPMTLNGDQLSSGGNKNDLQTSTGVIPSSAVRGSPGMQIRGSPERAAIQQQNSENRVTNVSSSAFTKNTPPRKKTGLATAL